MAHTCCIPNGPRKRSQSCSLAKFESVASRERRLSLGQGPERCEERAHGVFAAEARADGEGRELRECELLGVGGAVEVEGAIEE